MIMCVLLCYPLSIHMSQLLSTGCPISSCFELSATTFVRSLCQVLSNVKLVSLCGISFKSTWSYM